MIKNLETIKKIIIKVIKPFAYEPRRVSYTRLIILGLYVIVSFIATILFAVGNMLSEGVMIVNPLRTRLSEEAGSAIYIFQMVSIILFLLYILSFFMVLYKEYQEYQAVKIIKKYKLDVKVSSIDNPSIKDLLNMEHWAIINNLHVHPAFLKAEKKKQRILTIAYSTIILLLIVTSIIIINMR